MLQIRIYKPKILERRKRVLYEGGGGRKIIVGAKCEYNV